MGETFQQLNNNRCSCVPEEYGIYIIYVPDGMKITFLSKNNKKFDKTFTGKRDLANKYSNCKDKSVLYMGKASGKKGLKQRLKQYINQGFGNGKNHSGGRAIFQIIGWQNLIVEWYPVPDPSTEEHKLLEKYYKNNNCLPLANWRK